MAKIYNTDCTKGLAQNAAIQQVYDKVPNELAEKIVPTFETNPKLLRNNYLLCPPNIRTTSGSATLYTTSADKKTFMTAIDFRYIKDVVCDVASGSLSFTYYEANTNIQRTIYLPIITLTAQQDHLTIEFNKPIEIKPNSAIALANNTFAAGVLIRTLTIWGYEIDNPNA